MSGLGKLFVNVEELPNNAFGFIQMLFLAFCYSKILAVGGGMIADGSELLLLIPSIAPLVGACLLPLLGAVPDGAIVVFSGLGPDAQQQLSVGIGALAGSTIMLLTVPWVLSMVAGRVDFDPDGNGTYKKPTGAPEGWSKLSKPYFETGVNVDDNIKHSAFAMLLTMMSMFVIQIPACFAGCTMKDDESACTTPKWAALTAGVLCIVFFVWYLYDQYSRSKVDAVVEDKILRMQEKCLSSRVMSARAMFALDGAASSSAESQSLITSSGEKFEAFVRRIFAKFDKDKSGHIEQSEVALLLKELGEHSDAASVAAFIKEVDQDNDGKIDFKEFFTAMRSANDFGTGVLAGSGGKAAAARGSNLGSGSAGATMRHAGAGGTAHVGDVTTASDAGHDDEEEGEDSDEEVPEDLADLPPEEQRKRVGIRAAWMMTVGTLIVLLFSDPMVDILSNMGTRTGIKPFFIAFVLAPLVSNGSELIAAYGYAQKKTVKSASISFATLLGAAVMNNTFCLMIFLFLVVARDLRWVFTAEVSAMIVVELIMFGLVAFCGKSMSSKWVPLVACLMPLSIGFVAGLEAAGLD